MNIHNALSISFYSALPVGIIALMLFFITGASAEQHNAHSGMLASNGYAIENPFKKLELAAQGIYVWDIKNQRALYEKNPESQLPLASLTKLMTVLVSTERLGEDSTLIITSKDLSRDGDSGLRVGETWHVNDLIGLTLTASSNDGSYALANAVSATLGEKTFETLMNEKAHAIGMNQTFFVNESGLDLTEGISGSYGSPRDIALLVEYMIRNHPHLFENTQLSQAAFSSQSGIRHVVSNTNDIVEKLPAVVGSKTGFTDLAQGNLAVVFEAGPEYPITVIVLGSTRDERFADIEKLVWTSLEYLQNNVRGDISR